MILEALTGLLVIITGTYAWLTWRMTRASEASVQLSTRQIEASLRPYVEVSPYLSPGSIILYLRVRNVGRTAGTNLRLSLDRDFFQYGEHLPHNNLRSFAAFAKPIQSFPPGAELTFSLAQGFVVLHPDADQTLVPRQFTVTAQYSGSSGDYHESTTVDFTPFANAWVGEVPLKEELKKLADNSKDIASAVKTIASGGA